MAEKINTSNEKKSGRRSITRRLSKIIVALIVACGFGFLGGYIENQAVNNDSTNTGSLTHQKEVVSSESQLISKIAKTVGQSVVSVNVTSEQQSPMDFFGLGGTTEQADAGTGIIINSDGLIITNRHVVPAGTTNVSVTLSDGTLLNNVKVVGRTASNDSLDIAFLKIENAKGHKLVPATLGNSSDVKVGNAVVAIGNALGQFQNTVTSGIISGYGRNVQAGDETGSSSENLTDLFQTDAAINEGNSGGPLVDLNGDVIGINTAIAGQGAQNIGFAIPINDVKGLINQVEKTGKLTQPFLGVRFVPLTPDLAYEFNLSVNHGAYIAPSGITGQPSIVSGSPAAKAGLQEKDIITKVDGTTINDEHSLTALLSQHEPGDKVNLTIIRHGKTLQKTVTLGSRSSGQS